MKKIFTEEINLKNYIEEIRSLFEGKTIDDIFIENHNYYDDIEGYEFDDKIGRKLFWKKNANQDVNLELESAVILKIAGLYLSIEYACPKYFNEYPKGTYLLITDTPEDDLLNISHYYSKNIIGQKIEKIYSKRDYAVTLRLCNGYNFNINMLADNSVYLYECIPKKKNLINYEDLKEYRFEKYSKLKKYIDKIKKDFIGKKIENIKRLGIIFNNYNLYGKCLELDEAIDIEIGNNHLNIDFAYDSDTFCGINLFDYNETSYQDNLSWRSLNYVYIDNIIHQTIKDIILTKMDTSGYTDDELKKRFEDNFKAIHILLENGYIFEITNWEDYMCIDELPPQ